MFRPVESKPDFVAQEYEILEGWRDRQTFARLRAQNAELEWRVKDAHRELTNARRNRLVVDGTVERLTSNLDLSRTRVDELERWLGDGEVGVTGLDLGRRGLEELAVEGDRRIEIAHVEG